VCDDDFDNDGDDMTDCWDDECQSDAACQVCTESETITCGDTKSGSNSGGSSDLNNYSCSDWDESGPEKVYKFVPTQSGHAEAYLHDIEEGIDVDIFILENSCTNETCIEAGDESGNWLAQDGKTYYIVVDGYSGASGTFEITLDCLQ
jgi:hypothetical protein